MALALRIRPKDTGRNVKKLINKLFVVIYILTSILFVPTNTVHATPQDDLNSINTEIAQINQQLSALQKEKKTLQGEIEKFDLQIQAIQLKVNSAQAEIDLTNSKIAELNLSIEKLQINIEQNKVMLGNYVRQMYIDGQRSEMELILTSKSFSDFVDRSAYLSTMSTKIKETTDKIISEKQTLDNSKIELKGSLSKAESLKAEQVAARNGVEAQKSQKDALIAQTSGQESNYKAVLNDAQTRQAQAYQAYLTSISGASSSGGSQYQGGAGNGYLSWPLNATVTQGYGCTDFSQCGNPNGPYGGNIHNGIDIASWSGDPIHAAAEGIVLDTGSEYNSQGWGNWVAIKHPNGLATFYGHFISISVSPGQTVSRGETIGYEGSTGFSTGPHLHFSVYQNLTLYNTAGYHGPKYEGTVNPFTFL